jgi:DNA-binding MarR family transcriptional regulator
MMIVQRLKKIVPRDIDVAQRYYAILSTLNGFQLTERELQLMAFVAVNGSVSISGNREKFCNDFKTTSATVNNMVSKLKKKQVLTKSEGRIVINPMINLDFKKDLQLEIKIVHG